MSRRWALLGVLVVTGTAATTLAAMAALQQGLVRTEGWRHLFDPGPVDPGLGVLAFPAFYDDARPADSLALYLRPSAGRPAGFFIVTTDSMSQSFALEWPAPLATNLIEFDYEIPGLPFDSLSPDRRWARVIPGFGPDTQPVYAWARVGAGSARLVVWAEQLGQHDLFFRAGAEPAFFDAPAGRPVAFPLPADGQDYILHPLEARGAWLRVRAVTPSDMCADPASPRSAEVWIRYLDGSGRPRVWYHTRGC
jgi:hypothetical protein